VHEVSGTADDHYDHYATSVALCAAANGNFSGGTMRMRKMPAL